MVYLRAGYSPDDYPSEVQWQGRGKLERCSAVKCPSVAFQLAGAKKVPPPLPPAAACPGPPWTPISISLGSVLVRHKHAVNWEAVT